ncbi:MAG: 16S rRNA (uracil(1498)-N(3))-methyltransferase [Clostridiales bacterium]|nr:16S rRNA (uracil(1498)-N(3))-methyltransferase [Clostridiales bacterium]
MPRFFTEPENIKDNIITLSGDDAGHISRVLRSKIGEILTVCDGTGNDYEAEITEITEKEVRLNIIKTTFTASEPSVKITLYQGLPKGDKMETIIQKCVELGVTKIVPVNTERCIAKLDKNKEKKKTERWQKISESAAKQSGRGIIPEIGGVMSFSEAVKQASETDGAMIPYELEEDRGLKEFLDGFKGQTLAIFIGPEGGFSADEIDRALKAGILPVTLGKRILRTETAGMAAIANILFYIDM